MIHTSAAGGIVAYDRKSRRHNWNILVHAGSVGHARAVATNWARRVAGREGWEGYEQKVVRMTFDGGIVPDNLPRNYQWEPGTEREL